MSQIGSYSVSVKSFFSSWKEKADKKPADYDKKRKKTLKPIINPIFEKCAELTDDNFWKGIFMDCARGKFPRGFTFKNNLICFRKASKMTRLEVSASPMQAFQESKEFFQKFGGLLSEKDQLKLKQLEEEKLLQEAIFNEDITWKDVKSEKFKDILIIEFIEKLSSEYELGYDEKNELITNIKKGFMLKCFTASNIEMEKGKIVEIEGLIVNPTTKKSEIDPDLIKYKTNRIYYGSGLEKEEETPEINFLDTWAKFLLSLENKRTKNTQTFSTSYSTRNNDESLSNSYY